MFYGVMIAWAVRVEQNDRKIATGKGLVREDAICDDIYSRLAPSTMARGSYKLYYYTQSVINDRKRAVCGELQTTSFPTLSPILLHIAFLLSSLHSGYHYIVSVIAAIPPPLNVVMNEKESLARGPLGPDYQESPLSIITQRMPTRAYYVHTYLICV
jgi:hypothetical protein